MAQDFWEDYADKNLGTMTAVNTGGEPMLSFGITRSSSEGIHYAIAELQELARDIKPNQKLWDSIADDVLIPMIHHRFQTQDDGQWKPIAGITLAKRKRNKNPDDILIDTGQLYRAAVAKSRFRFDGNKMEYNFWPSSRRWAPFHQFGSRWTPPRPWTHMYNEDMDDVGFKMQEWLDGVIRERFKDDPAGWKRLGSNRQTQAALDSARKAFEKFQSWNLQAQAKAKQQSTSGTESYYTPETESVEDIVIARIEAEQAGAGSDSVLESAKSTPYTGQVITATSEGYIKPYESTEGDYGSEEGSYFFEDEDEFHIIETGKDDDDYDSYWD